MQGAGFPNITICDAFPIWTPVVSDHLVLVVYDAHDHCTKTRNVRSCRPSRWFPRTRFHYLRTVRADLRRSCNMATKRLHISGFLCTHQGEIPSQWTSGIPRTHTEHMKPPPLSPVTPKILISRLHVEMIGSHSEPYRAIGSIWFRSAICAGLACLGGPLQTASMSVSLPEELRPCAPSGWFDWLSVRFGGESHRHN
jgi:hypothetical protein